MILLLIALIIGMIAGFILEKSSLIDSRTIIYQLILKDYTMIKVLLSAIVTSAVIFAVLNFFILMPMEAFSFSVTKTIFGGIFIGVGVALTGSIPITIFAQIGVGYKDAIFVLVGGLLGGASYYFIKPFVNYIDYFSRSEITIYNSLGMPYWFMAIIFAFLLFLILVCFYIKDQKNIKNEEEDEDYWD